MWRRITVKVIGLVAGGQKWQTDRELQREQGVKTRRAQRKRKTCKIPTVNETAYLSAVMRDVQTEAFQGCQAHNSFVCYAIETSCSLLSQYLLPNGMCALLLALINNTRLKEGLITSPLCLSTPP